MRNGKRHWGRVIIGALSLLAAATSVVAVAAVDATADTILSYATIEPGRIKLGDTAGIRITTLYGHLASVSLPTVPGLEFEITGRAEGLEFIAGKSVPASFILIRVMPKFVGVFTIPGLIPGGKPLGLEVVNGNEPNPYAFHNPTVPQPKPVAPAPIPKGIVLKAGGAAFVQLLIPKHDIYVGESVPVDIEVGIRPGIVTSLNGPPTLSSSEFTLNDLSKQPIRREQVIEGSPFEILTWHTVLAAVKPGKFSLAVEAPLSVRDARSAQDSDIAARLGWPFSQILYNKVAPKDVKVPSPASDLKVLPLPPGEPQGFSGAVGDFQVTSDISPHSTAVGEPQTLRLHISGAGNFDRVSSSMLDHLDHWKTYPVKSAFTPRNAVGYSGEKVFEQPLIAESAGQQTIPALEFSYFNPNTQRYERISTQPIDVTIATSPDAVARSLDTKGLRPDHPQPRSEVDELRPLYFRGEVLGVSLALALTLLGGWFGVRRPSAVGVSKQAERVLRQLDAAARTGESSSFFEVAHHGLLQAFAARWRIAPEEITATELHARLGPTGEEIERLFALADEAKYSGYRMAAADFERWMVVIRSQLTRVDL
jgi:hypothetical protein